MSRQLVSLRISTLDVLSEIPAVTAKRVGVLIQGFQQFEDLRKLLLIEFLVIGQIAQFDFLDTKLNQDFV
jgi:hypothetical protein